MNVSFRQFRGGHIIFVKIEEGEVEDLVKIVLRIE